MITPAGLCQCGCGRLTTIATATQRKYGWIKGAPKRFIDGHNSAKQRAALSQPESYRLVALTQDAITKVSIEDYGAVVAHRWQLRPDGYASAMINGKGVLLHRFIMKLSPDQQADHRNHDRLDNRRDNLRICTTSQNMANRVSKLKFKGVYRHGASWRAQLKANGTLYRVGRLSSPEEAAKVYNELAQRHFGEFAVLNLLP